MSCFPETNSCISGRNLVKDKSGILPAYSAAAAKMISAFVHLEKYDCMWDSMSVDAIKKIDERERKKIGQIRKYAQELRDNIEKENRKNK
jgi:hypothetical protein